MSLLKIKDYFFGSLQRRLVSGIVLVVAGMMSVFVWEVTRMQQNLILEERSSHAIALAQNIATSSAVWVASRDFSGLQEIINGLQAYPDLKHAIVLDLQGQVLAHSQVSLRGLFLLDLPEKAVMNLVSQNAEMVDVAHPIVMGDSHIGWVRLGLGQDSVTARLQQTGMNAVVFTLFAVLLAAVFAYWAVKQLTMRLNVIQHVANQVESGQRSLRANLAGKDEAAQLGQQFDAMLDTLEKSEYEQKQVHQALVRSESRLNQVMRVTGEGIWDWDIQTNKVSHNQSWCDILGLDDRFLQHDLSTFSDLVYEEDRPNVLKQIQACLEQRQAYRCEYRMHRADGELIWVQDRGDVVERDDAGQPLRMMGSLLDVTVQKQLNQDLNIAAVAFELQEGMYITDDHANILKVNRAFSDITGFSQAEVVGKTPKVFRSGRHDDTFYQALYTMLKRTGGWQGEVWNQRKNGEVYPAWLTITTVKNEQGEITHYVAAMTDITQRKNAEEAIKNLAFYDSLTHLPNRRLLLDRLQQALSHTARDHAFCALMFLDLDNFKTLNDTLGHDVGDLLLQQVAERLLHSVRAVDTVARLGGDEFVLMLSDLGFQAEEAASHAEMVAEKVLHCLNQPYSLSGQDYHSTPSIGVTLFSGQDVGVDDLLKRADLAMYQAKSSGRNTVRFFDPEMQASVSARVSLESDLRQALANDQFELHLQKQVDQEGRVLGAEALIRWPHPQKGLIAPNTFIPLAEETGLIIDIGDWVLLRACEQLKQWQTIPALSQVTLAINVSPRQFSQESFVSKVVSVIEQTGVKADHLKIEITESMLLSNLELVISKMEQLKQFGVKFALDDFGTGYSSMSYLKRLPLDQLKIDQSFVRDIFSDANDAAITRAIIAMADSLGLEVIAEGVETEEQKQALLSMGCNHYQGYYFGRPVVSTEFDV